MITKDEYLTPKEKAELLNLCVPINEVKFFETLDAAVAGAEGRAAIAALVAGAMDLMAMSKGGILTIKEVTDRLWELATVLAGVTGTTVPFASFEDCVNQFIADGGKR